MKIDTAKILDAAGFMLVHKSYVDTEILSKTTGYSSLIIENILMARGFKRTKEKDQLIRK